MAAEAPDPKTFQSWEEGFQYPIAAVRGMERQLRNDIDSNREKLRSLVGASYRDLLGTAETILDMDSEMRNVETYLGDMGVRCNSRLLDKEAANLRAWNNDIQTRDKERYILASQLAVLRGCPEAISRLLKSGGSVLQAAKILVISRLLHKKLSHETDPPPYLEVLRRRLASLRRKLLAKVDWRFKSLDASESALVEAMRAFSLATSSSATDVLRHFHHVRQSTMSELGKGEDDEKGIFKALRLFVKTLKDCHSIVPTQLARALEGLKATPLLQASDLHSQLELNLDVHQRWLGEDINSFVPYVRPDDLQKTEAARHLMQWAKSALSTFLEDLKIRLANVEDPAVIVDLRQEMLELWLFNQQHSTGVDKSEVLEGIRDAFNNRHQALIHQRCACLGSILSTIASLLEDWETGVSDACPSMWDDPTTTLNTHSNVKILREALSVRAFGRSEPVQAASMAYVKWLDSIRNLESVIKRLRETRWTSDSDDIADDDVLENKQILLSEDDPRLLQETLQSDVEQYYHQLQQQMRKHTDDLQPTIDGDRQRTISHKACFLLRVWREITSHLPSSYPKPDLETTFIRTLQSQVSKNLLHQPLLRCEKRISTSLHQNQLQIRILWEGDPQLPVMPSPYAFRFLHDIAQSMAVIGADIWTAQAVGILKQQLREALAPIVGKLPEARRQINGHISEPSDTDNRDPHNAKDITVSPRSSEQDGEEEEDKKQDDSEETQTTKPDGDAQNQLEGPSEEVARDMKIQRLFDILYLQHATSLKDSDSDDALHRIQSAVETSLDLPGADMKRMRKGVEAYWKRTELLFALLA